MRVISKRRLREFWKSRRHDVAIAERDLSTWHKLAKNSRWSNFAELKLTFGSADQVGNCVVFDIGNNRYRLIGRLNYARSVLYVLRVMDHHEYDKGLWVADCGCRQPPPKKPHSQSESSPRTRSSRDKHKKRS
jgi:mRNA interferase HigB